MKPIDPQEWKQDLPAFREKTAAFYKGELKKNDYKASPVFMEAMPRRMEKPVCFVFV